MTGIEVIEMLRETAENLTEHLFERDGFLSPAEIEALEDLQDVCQYVRDYAVTFNKFNEAKRKYSELGVKGV